MIYIFYVYKVYIGVRSKRETSLRFISPSTLSVLFGFGRKVWRNILQNSPRTRQLVVVFVDEENDGSDGGPEVFAGPGHVQPDPLTCGWRPSGALDQDFGQPSVEGREGLHWLNAGIGE